MRIIIEIQGDELGSATHPTSVTITFPSATTAESAAVQTVVEHAVEQQVAAADAGSAPVEGAASNEPIAYVATQSQAETDLSATDAEGGDVATDGRSAVDAGTPPRSAFDVGTAVTGAPTEPLRSAVDTGKLIFSAEVIAAEGSAAPTGLDDLTVIDGIGPKISSVLMDSGITTYEQLARSDVSDLQRILSDADVRANAETWPGQAAVAATDDLVALEAYQTNLKGA